MVERCMRNGNFYQLQKMTIERIGRKLRSAPWETNAHDVYEAEICVYNLRLQRRQVQSIYVT